MRKLILTVIVSFSVCAVAQQPASKPELAVKELKIKIAEQTLEIAQLKAQVNEMQLMMQLYEASVGVTARRNADQQAIQRAQRTLSELKSEVPPK